MVKKILFLFLMMFASFLMAQNVAITGTVTDANGEPLIGVNVVVKGTSTGAITDLNGAFTVNGKQGDVLVFTYIGMESQVSAAGGVLSWAWNRRKLLSGALPCVCP